MAIFDYQALNSSGEEVSGRIEAANEKNAVSKLRERGLRPFEVETVNEKVFNLMDYVPFFGGKIASAEEIALFTRQMATLLKAGLPLLRAINILEEQTENDDFKRVIEQISQDIQGGASFSDSLRRHPSVFDDLYVNMVKAGEVGGVMDKVLERLSDFAESAEELKTKIKSAVMYPAVIFCMALVVVTFLLLFVIPTFISLFQEMGVALPLPTRIVVGASNFVLGYWYLLIGGAVLGWYILKWYYNTDKGEHNIDNLKINLPIFGSLFRKVSIARFARTLATLIRSGVPILQAIEIVQDTIGNRVVSEKMDDVYDSISEGDTMSEPLHQSGVFPPMVTHMISVGEETGNLDGMLARVADTYEMQVEEMVDGLSSMLEPILILFMAIVVGTIVMAIFFPMFQLVQVVG